MKATFVGLVAALSPLAGTAITPAGERPLPGLCAPATFEQSGFIVCTVDPADYDLRLFLDTPDGKPYGSLEAFAAAGPAIVFAMNAGMYLPDSSPEGLFVEGGRTVMPLNTRDASDLNFYLKPNGVFSVGVDGHAAVVETSRFEATPEVAYATQSGPMLVIDGQMHPKFDANGTSLHVRNGIGMRADGKVVFAISLAPVSFGRFARLFRKLGCADALYFDGSISRLWDPVAGRMDTGAKIGPIVVVLQKR